MMCHLVGNKKNDKMTREIEWQLNVFYSSCI